MFDTYTPQCTCHGICMYTMPMSTASSATPMANPNSANNGYYDLVPSIQSPVEWFDSSCGAITARLRTIIVLANITKNETVYSDSCRSCNSSLGPARICALSPSDLMCVCVCLFLGLCSWYPPIRPSASAATVQWWQRRSVMDKWTSPQLELNRGHIA